MRFPLALKVSGWLLLNLALLAVLAAGFLGIQGGFSWDSLIEGPPGRRMQTLAEVAASELRTLPPDQRSGALARFAEAQGVAVAWLDNGRWLTAGGAPEIPSALREWARSPGRPPEFDRPPPEDDPGLGPEFGPFPPHEPRPHRLLIRTGQPAAFWLAVRTGPPDRASVLVLRVPSFGRLLTLLDLTPWLQVAASVAVVSLLFWLPFVRGLTRDLGRLTQATEAIADGRFDTRVAETRRDELGALGGSVNRMAGRLDRLVTGQKRFLGDIAHELGSPLGRMQVSVGILEQRVEPALQPAVGDVREEVEQMAALVNELLAFTKAGLRPREAFLAPVPLGPLVAHLLTREAADDAVRVEIPADLAVRADADLLARALGNLVRNALRHAGRAAGITLRTEIAGETVRIIVEDQGPGVPPEALGRLGEPLFRPETARTRETGGAGLGLAIVKSCVEACGGSVQFENRTPRGFRAILRLTAAPFTPA